MSKTPLLLQTLVVGCCLLGACGGGGSGPAPKVVIQGEQVIAVGQSSLLFANTLEARDGGYAWSSDDPLVATVDGQGLVTGVAPGETCIHAIGRDSGLEATCRVTVVESPGAGIPNYEAWRGSAHGDRSATAFSVWDPLGEVPADCARCHSTYGFRDWLGADGSPAGSVEAPAAIGTVVDCGACHNPAVEALEIVTLPSGAELSGPDADVLCMQCHGGRSSTDAVDAIIAAEDLPDADTASARLRLPTTHYLQAGATLVGGLGRGGYQYPGHGYDARFGHVEYLSSCTDCHDPHGLELPYAYCAGCHPGSTDATGARGIRMASSFASDYDGDGDRSEGVHEEIQGLLARLHDAMRAYAAAVVGAPIAFRPNPAPNFYEDLDDDGGVGAEEETPDNQYHHWTPRLLRAAYNVQFAMNDPGAYAHNAKYVIQLLHDSLQDVNAALPQPQDLSALDRADPGHFDGSGEAARHWDGEGSVPAACARCHTGSVGLTAYLLEGTDATDQDLPNGLDCITCHDGWASSSLRRVYSVVFPGGAVHTDDDDRGLVCMVCHAGRASGSTIQDAITAGDLGFQDVHHLPAAAVLLGAEISVGYEYPGRIYAGARAHSGGSGCLSCHVASTSSHVFDAAASIRDCSTCHGPLDSVRDIRLLSRSDFDGDGDSSEPLREELTTLAAQLLSEIQHVAQDAGSPIAYDTQTYPYFFHDVNGNGIVDPSEATHANSYGAWTPRLLRAAHNYQIARKEPGAWAHNFSYAAQLLVDSIEDLGGDVTSLTRP